MPTATNAGQRCAKTKKKTGLTPEESLTGGGDNPDDSNDELEQVFSGTCAALLEVACVVTFFCTRARPVRYSIFSMPDGPVEAACVCAMRRRPRRGGGQRMEPRLACRRKGAQEQKDPH